VAPTPVEKQVAGSVGGHVIMDQEQVQHNGALSARTLPGYTIWQSFTAGRTGTLVHIDMGFLNDMAGVGELRIYEGAGTSGELLQARMVNVVAFDRGGMTWNRWSVKVPVVGGRRYTFELKPDRKSLPDPYVAATDSRHPYSGGAFGLTDPAQSGATDFNGVFRTWVDIGAGGKKGAGQSKD
jgi:hypothetical protein